MLMMCGCVGQSGGGWAHYVGQEKLRPQTGWQPLAFALDWNRPPRRAVASDESLLHMGMADTVRRIIVGPGLGALRELGLVENTKRKQWSWWGCCPGLGYDRTDLWSPRGSRLQAASGGV